MAKGLIRFLGLGAAWAFIYALPSVPIEGLANLGVEFSFTYAVDMWPFELGLPGFVGGVFFAGLLALSGQLRGFETLPTGRLAGWGGLAGVLLGAFYHATSLPNSLEQIGLIFGIAVPLGIVAGPGSALIFRFLARRRGHSAARARA